MRTTRRQAMILFGTTLLVSRRASAHDTPVVEVDLHSVLSERGHTVSFDPVGLHVSPGTTIRWINRSRDVHNVVAYHPDNGNVPLRIPRLAVPWQSPFLLAEGESWSVTLSYAGVYDYFCAPHEVAGMAGRIVVGEPMGPGSEPFDYWRDLNPPPDWRPIPPAVRERLPSAERIMAERRVFA